MRAPNPNGSGAANRPAQVFDVEIWNKLRQEASQSERIAAQAQDLTLIAICAYRQDIVNEGFSHLLPMELILGQCIMGLVVSPAMTTKKSMVLASPARTTSLGP